MTQYVNKLLLIENIERLKDNFTFCLFVGWFLFAVAIITVGIIFTDELSDLYKYRYYAWAIVAVFGFIMFVFQNIYIYLY